MWSTQHLHLISNAINVYSDYSGSKSNPMHWLHATDLWEEQRTGSVLWIQSNEKVSKTYLFFTLLSAVFLILTSQQFKYTCFLCNCLSSRFGGICWAPTVCHARGWRCREKAVWTVGRDGCISWEWWDSADNGVVGEPEWTEVQEVVNGWRDEKGMEVRNSRERWGNHKEVRWSECKSVQIWEWWAVTDPGDILLHQGL